jgi:hypothetical protein
MSCGCNNNAVKVTEKLDGKPTATPEGSYNGVGGTVKWPTK